MKKILVTGSNGYIGNALVLALLNRKKEFTVRAAARRGSILNSKSFETVRLGSLEESLDYVEDFKGCDVLIHCASRGSMRGHEGWLDEAALHRINVLGTVHMAREAHRAGISRFIFLSSLQVNGPETPAGKRFYADSLPRPKSPIGKALLEAEKELTRVGEETGMEIVIVRPPLIYGPDCQNLFGEVKIMVDYCLPLPLRSCKRNHRSLVGIDNLVDFLICCATHPDAANETFLVSDGVDLSTLNIFKLLAKTHHRPCLLWPFPPILVRLFNSYIGRQAWEEFFFQSQVADIHKAQLVLGWTPPLSVEQSFRRSWDENFYLGSHTSSK